MNIHFYWSLIGQEIISNNLGMFLLSAFKTLYAHRTNILVKQKWTSLPAPQPLLPHVQPRLV